jgi:soluble lytic murein transglycosylase
LRNFISGLMKFTTIVVAVCILGATAAQAADKPPASSNPNIASIPQPLSKADAALYRQIFAAQVKGSWRRANRLIKKLSNRLLLGHVQAQRYLHRTHYRSRYKELAAWLKDYADHPDAPRIYKLALSRKPRRYRAPRRPVLPKRTIYSESGNGGIVRSGRRGLRYSRSARRLHSQVRRLVRRKRLSSAEKLIKQPRFRRLGQAHVDIAKMRIGSRWFYLGEDRKAFNTASKAAHRSGKYYPLGHWYAGLASYRSGRYVNAADHFQAMAATGGQSRWSQSAAAFWAARANLVARRPDRVSRWLRLAASHPRTFYGLLARRMLGIDSSLKWTAPKAQQQTITNALKSPRAQRALALLQAGNHPRAERELRYLGLSGGSGTRIVLLNIADQFGLPSLALKTAIALMRQNQTRIDRGLYPVPHWEPSDGFKIDRALVYAVMRQESAFNTRAKSHAGARGLMQLMPGTAGYMARKRFRGRARNKLYEPGLNLRLGQKYLRYLLRHDKVKGNILMMAAAYNGGPGNLSKWQRRILKRSSDTLMFIESMPARETRDYVERVLANFWIYRDRFGQQAPTLDAIAAGEPPVYKSVDTP